MFYSAEWLMEILAEWLQMIIFTLDWPAAALLPLLQDTGASGSEGILLPCEGSSVLSQSHMLHLKKKQGLHL